MLILAKKVLFCETCCFCLKTWKKYIQEVYEPLQIICKNTANMTFILNKPPLNTGDFIYEIKDGMLFIERLKRTHFTIENLKENVRIRFEYTEKLSYPAILFGKDILSMDKPAREYLSTEGAKNILSRAFVIEKSQGKLALHFFIQTNKQEIPVEIFDNMEPAIEWSKQFKRKV